MYQVIITPSAKRQLEKLDRTIRTRLIAHIEALAEQPRPPGVKKLTDQDGYRIRVGEYRIIYTIEDNIRKVWIIRTGHRREIYL
jgi:mRNA interferase RelE/StbE